MIEHVPAGITVEGVDSGRSVVGAICPDEAIVTASGVIDYVATGVTKENIGRVGSACQNVVGANLMVKEVTWGYRNALWHGRLRSKASGTSNT
jgi:hypothetical protein